MTEEVQKFTEEEIKEANAEISKEVQKAYRALEKAEEIADKFGLEFRFEPAYGMGGWFTGVGDAVDPDETDDYGYEKYGWMASSQSC